MIISEHGILQEFDLVIYPVQLVVAIGNVEKDINRLYKPYDEKFNYISCPSANPAATYEVRNKKTNDICSMIWIPKTDDVRGSYISHEAGHVALEIFKYVGAHVDYDDQEPFCYLQGAIFRLASNAFYKWKEYYEKNKEVKPQTK